MPSVDFWFEFASTYSYPAAMRIERQAAQAGVTVRWRPFLLGPIFASQGWNNSPFNIYEAKGRYMWRDLERICAAEGLPLEKPSVFPQNGLKAARIAMLGASEAWGPDFVRAVYLANFAAGHDISDETLLAAILAELGLDAASIVEAANAQENKDALRAQTEEAKSRGIFGAPSFTIGDELFWGNDRLEQALAWAQAAG